MWSCLMGSVRRAELVRDLAGAGRRCLLMGRAESLPQAARKSSHVPNTLDPVGSQAILAEAGYPTCAQAAANQRLPFALAAA